MRHTCFKARCDVRVVICLDGHPLLHTTAHYSSVIMARLILFLFFFVMTCSFHSSPTERSWLGFLSCSSSLSSFSWAVTGVRPSLALVTAQKWTEIVSHFMSLPPLFLLLNLTSFTVMAHLTLLCCTHWYMYILFPSPLALLLNVLKSIFNIFSSPLLKPGPLLKPFSSVPSFPCFPLCFPLVRLALLPSSSSTQVVSQRFPQNSIGAVGSAMFLRFVNPAIVSPYEAGILDKKPLPRIERGLKLMSKVKRVNMMVNKV